MTQQEFTQRYTYSVRTDKLGGGAFGTVYKAYDNTLNKYVAIKIAEVKTINGKEFSLLDEFDAIKGLSDHPNIANYDEVYTFEQPTGIYDYAIIQYYPHGNLSNLIEKGNLSYQEKEDLAIQILEGLSFLHKHSVVHRDMKPSNILIHKHDITGRYIPKIADFGLSKKADLNQSRFTNSFGGGTLAYSSPEQLKGQELKFNTDLWAWGVMVYELFTEKPLFSVNSNSSSSAQREKEIFEDIISKDVSIDLKKLPNKWEKALQKCLIRNNEQRARSVNEILRIIGAVSDETDEKTIIPIDDTTVKEIDINQKSEKSDSNENINKEQSNIRDTKKNKKLQYIFIAVIAVFLIGIASLFFHFKSKSVEQIEPLAPLTYIQAKQKFTELHNVQIEGDLTQLENMFANEFTKYYNENNISLNKVMKSIRAYSAKWAELNMELKSFTDQGENRYLYEAKYVYRSRETNEIYENEIKGYVGFIEEDNAYKITELHDVSNIKIIKDTGIELPNSESNKSAFYEIKNTINKHFYYNDNGFLNELIDTFNFPVKRYFNNKSVKQSKITDIYKNTFEKLSNIEHEINWQKTKVVMNKGVYEVYLIGEYSYFDIETNKWKNSYINNVMLLNKNYKIIEYYKR